MKKKLRRKPLSDNDLRMSIKHTERKLARLKKEKAKRVKARTTPKKRKVKILERLDKCAEKVRSPGGRCGLGRCSATGYPSGRCGGGEGRCG